MTSVLQSPKVYSTILSPLAGGVGGEPFIPEPNGSGNPDPNYFSSSRITSVIRRTVGGTAGNVVAKKQPPTGAGVSAFTGVAVYSSNVLDTSVYEVQWVNDYIPSQYLTQGGLLAGAQFQP
jgi:hypothetical protein